MMELSRDCVIQLTDAYYHVPQTNLSNSGNPALTMFFSFFVCVLIVACSNICWSGRVQLYRPPSKGFNFCHCVIRNRHLGWRTHSTYRHYHMGCRYYQHCQVQSDWNFCVCLCWHWSYTNTVRLTYHNTNIQTCHRITDECDFMESDGSLQLCCR